MKVKTASSGEQFRREAKKYVINMRGNKKKLHIKNGCHWASFFSEYYDFDSLVEAKNCGVESTLCGNCFKDR